MNDNENYKNYHSSLLVCENCEFARKDDGNRFLTCLLENQDKGLFEYCDNFKRRDGEHYTI